MISLTTLQQAAQRLAKAFAPRKIILFGSHARGTADDKSDVDLPVIMPVEGGRRRLIAAMDRELSGLGFARDIVILTPDEYEADRLIPGTIARPASVEGKVLYERAG